MFGQTAVSPGQESDLLHNSSLWHTFSISSTRNCQSWHPSHTFWRASKQPLLSKTKPSFKFETTLSSTSNVLSRMGRSNLGGGGEFEISEICDTKTIEKTWHPLITLITPWPLTCHRTSDRHEPLSVKSAEGARQNGKDLNLRKVQRRSRNNSRKKQHRTTSNNAIPFTP